MSVTFRRRLQGTTIKDRCRGLSAAALRFSQQQPQIVYQGGNSLGIMLQGAPSLDPAQAVEDFAEAVAALSGVFGQ